MIKMEIENLSNAVNAAVIRLPGRQFPGIVLQGDSLKILMTEAEEVARLSRKTSMVELANASDHLVDLLRQYVRCYEEALKLHGMPLPY